MSARAWLAFGALGIIWGLPYLFIKIAVLARHAQERAGRRRAAAEAS